MSLFTAAIAALTLVSPDFLSFTNAVPIVVTPGPVANMLITVNTTINATTPAGHWFAPQPNPASYLPLALVNKLSSNNVKAYVTGLNENNQLVFLNRGGQWYFPTTTSGVPVPIPDDAIAIPLGAQGSTTYTTIPGYLSASRVWFSDGPLQFSVVGTPNGPGLVEPAAVNPNDPNANVNYGFGELTWNQGGGIFADISFVDFVGMPVGIQLTTTDGTPTQQALGLPHDAVNSVCNDLQAQSRVDGQPWAQECVYTRDGRLIRVLAPIDLLSAQPDAWHGYFDAYIDAVFQYHAVVPLTINTQSAAGMVTCRSDPRSMTMSCDGDNRVYGRPSSRDIFGCNSGPFGFAPGDNAVHYAIVPRLCAAFNRGTFLTLGGDVQPGQAPEVYYPLSVSALNWFSKIVHKYDWNNKGYAFSYDDVSPTDEQNVAGVVASGRPATLTFLVGGYDL